MLGSIGHRGQDGRGIWCQGPVGLAHCLRRLGQRSRHERQPELSPQADLVLVADARIDNRLELIHDLSLLDQPAHEVTDSRLILAAYQKWGELCPEKLEGDFAFALWDAQRRSIFCARDTSGVKPFYYFKSSRFFVFASEIKAILAIPDIPRRLNERKLLDYLIWSFEDTQDTIYQDIHRLPPASTLTITPEGERLRQYWSLDPEREIHLENDAAYICAFREIFDRAVRNRTDGISRVGSTLSGGLDSSSIACTLREQLAQKNRLPLKVFSVIFPQSPELVWTGIDERFYIEEVLVTGGFEVHYVDASQLDPLIDPDRLSQVMDEPCFAPTLFLFWGLLQAAQKAGVEVLLDGTDGDSTISHGEEYLTDLVRSGHWREFHTQAIALINVQNNSSRLSEVIWKYGIRPFIPSRLIDIKRHLITNLIPRRVSPTIIRQEFARQAGYEGRIPSVPGSQRHTFKSAREKHRWEMTSGLNALSLELFDKASASFSLEMRFPFYDRRLMEYCLALPGEQKLSQGWTRHILRAAMRDLLPDSVRLRTNKSNLFQAFNIQFQRVDKSRLDRGLSEANHVLQNYIDIKIMDKIYNDYWAQPSNRLINAYIIYGVITLAKWLIWAGIG